MKQLLRNHLPRKLYTLLLNLYHPYENYLIKRQPHRYDKIVEDIKHKDKIKVAFFAIVDAAWKCDKLYQLMVDHPKFEPIIVVCPMVNYGMENMLSTMGRCYEMFKSKGYNVVRTYDVLNQTYMDVRKEINPDVIFYTNPYKGLIDDRYYVTSFLDRLTCYIPYGYAISNSEYMLFNQLLHNLVWKNFYETEIHKQMATKYARNKAKNVIVSGYLLFDEFDEARNVMEGAVRSDNRKNVIWAPHHTIEDDRSHLGYSCFLKLSDYFLKLKESYANRIYWYFKPHPLLKVKLYQHPDWGKEKTDNYYKQWEKSEVCEICEGSYTEIFLKSDAMIFDSISFIAEYYYTGKPSLFLVKDDSIKAKFNEFGKKAYAGLYKAYTEGDVESFIENTILAEKDIMKNVRDDFYNQVQKKDNVSLNILKCIVKELS